MNRKLLCGKNASHGSVYGELNTRVTSRTGYNDADAKETRRIYDTEVKFGFLARRKKRLKGNKT